MATTPSATPPSTPTIHCPVNYSNLNESWCDIQYKSGCSSSGSISHLHHTVNPEILEKLLQEAQRESQSPSLSKSYPAHTAKNYQVFPEPSSIQSQTSMDSLSNSVHQLDTSTPMLVTFDTSHKQMSPLNSQNIPTSPINKIEDDIAKTLTNFNNMINSPINCSQCFTHKQQMEKLIEKQQDTEKQLNILRKEYEEKCLSKTPDFMSQSTTSSISSSSVNEDEDLKNLNSKSVSHLVASSLKRQNSSSSTLISMANNNNNNNYSTQGLTELSSFGYASGIYNYNSCPGTNLNPDNGDWIKYWPSRPQCQPPKEFNFVHPNSAKSKLNNIRNMDISDKESTESKGIIAKYIQCDSISKILFTHMASFIVGATLMFLVLRRHFSLRSSMTMK